MTNFWDLPRPVRDTIYRFHLVRDEPITRDDQLKLAKARQYQGRWRNTKWVPTICAISKKADREAAPIFFGENHFVFGPLKDGSDSRVVSFAATTWTRHLRMIRKVTIQWPKPTQRYGAWGGVAREAFLEISRMTGLQELYVRVDEAEMVRDQLWVRRPRRPHLLSPNTPLSHQDNLAIMRHPGITGLLAIHDVAHVEFLKHWDYSGAESGGPIPGGVLETVIAPRLRGSKRARLSQQDGAFPFLDLPPELRNRIYSMLLVIDGPLEPSPKPPSSAPKKCSSDGRLPAPGSALNIVAVNRQIHDEAVGVFYHANQFLFRTPPQLAAFIVTLGDLRLSSLREITLHYQNDKSGGIELAGIALPMLKQLTGLQKLHILLRADIYARMHWRYFHVIGSYRYAFHLCNPLVFPGIRSLFDLRGIAEIRLRDTLLDEEIDELKKHASWPDRFPADSKDKGIIKLAQIMDHFNAALADAQLGRVNRKMLADDEWPNRDDFPVIEEVHEKLPSDTEDGEDKTDAVESGAEMDESETETDVQDQMEGQMANQTEDQTQSRMIDQTADQTEDVIIVSSKRGGSSRYSLRRVKEEMEEADETKRAAEGLEADEMEAHGTVAEVAEDEIVVKHVGRVKHARAGRPKSAASGVRLGGFDGASDEVDGPGAEQMEAEADEMEDEDQDEDDSYFAREASVEL